MFHAVHSRSAACRTAWRPYPLSTGLALVLTLIPLALEQATAQEVEIPEPEEVTLVTSDRVELHCTWLGGTHEKETAPIIMLHRWDAEQADLDEQLKTAIILQQKYGYAVLVPELRGHGRSMTLENSTNEFERKRWGAIEITGAIEDIEACKKFLVQKNNDGQVNIDLLCLVAEQETSIHALIWTLRDWSYRPVAGRKQGQDVKALVLINPVRNFSGVNGMDYYRNALFTGGVGAGFPVLVAASSRDRRDPQNIHDAWERDRRALDEGKRNLDFVNFRVEKQSRIVKVKGEDDKLLSQVIGDFLQKQVVDRQHDFRWQDRSSH